MFYEIYTFTSYAAVFPNPMLQHEPALGVPQLDNICTALLRKNVKLLIIINDIHT